jgi:gamma-glutamylcyclotransferase
VYYFAYASNLSHKRMRERCPGSKPRFKARLPNYKLIFTGWSRKWRGGVATIRRFGGEQVIGGVYEISERDLRVLDEHEGYPTVYDRVNVLVIPEDGDAVEAVTYIKREQSEETQPSPEYLTTIQQGYKDWGIG